MRHLVYNHLWNGGSPSHHGYHGVQYSNALIWMIWGTIISGNLHNIVLGLIDVSPFIPPCSPKTGPSNSPKTIPTNIPHLPPHLRKATPEKMPKSGSHVSGSILGDIYLSTYLYIYILGLIEYHDAIYQNCNGIYWEYNRIWYSITNRIQWGYSQQNDPYTYRFYMVKKSPGFSNDKFWPYTGNTPWIYLGCHIWLITNHLRYLKEVSKIEKTWWTHFETMIHNDVTSLKNRTIQTHWWTRAVKKKKTLSLREFRLWCWWTISKTGWPKKTCNIGVGEILANKWINLGKLLPVQRICFIG